jgi:hypothetical protein
MPFSGKLCGYYVAACKKVQGQKAIRFFTFDCCDRLSYKENVWFKITEREEVKGLKRGALYDP